MKLSFPYIVNHIPKTTPYNRRPGILLNYDTITIHSTGNVSSTAQNERGWLVNKSNTRTASWHICVDEKQAIEAIPLNEVAWHAGDGGGSGNMKSLSIEVCEGGNRDKTLNNAIELIAYLLKQKNWNTKKLKRHYDWSGKLCPRIFIAGNWQGWKSFLSRIESKLIQTKVLPKIEREVGIFLGGKKVNVDGYMIGGSVFVPVRFFAESFGKRVDWNNNTYTVDIR